MKIILRLLVLVLPYVSYTQSKTGIHFEKSLSWNQILSKAKAENKYIFVDCFTTWCAPCKYMSEKIFPLEDVGKIFNEKFISVKVQMDQTRGDAAYIRAWYQQAKSFETRYSVNAYPTYLFFSPQGVVVHRIIGSTKDQNEFINKALDALDSLKQYYPLIGQYKNHVGDSAFLSNSLQVALVMQDSKNAYLIADLLIKSMKYPYSSENLKFILKWTSKIGDNGYQLLWNRFSIKQNLGEVEDNARRKLIITIAYESVDSLFAQKSIKPDWNLISGVLEHNYATLMPDLLNSAKNRFEINVILKEIDPEKFNSGNEPDWNKMSRIINAKYPICGSRWTDSVIAFYKQDFYFQKQDWTNYGKAAIIYLNNFTPNQNYSINNILWHIFRFSTDLGVLTEAARWSRFTIQNYPKVDDWTYVDTYANLLYKLGSKNDAIEWERKAIEIAGNKKDKEEFEENLNKMTKGLNTWN